MTMQAPAMVVTRIALLGRPCITHGPDGQPVHVRSRKTWSVLAYLLLADRPPTRRQLAELLFSEADDPLRALRWCLFELRRVLGDGGSVEGDPLRLVLAATTEVDVRVVLHDRWDRAVTMAGLGGVLLDGQDVKGAAAFGTWLLLQQRHVAAGTEAVLHEAAVAWMSRGEVEPALGYAVRALAMSPLDENHHALVIRLYRLDGDHDAAARQLASCRELLAEELGVEPGPIVAAAMREPIRAPDTTPDELAIAAVVEAGVAAVGAGAVEAGVASLRTAVRMADAADAIELSLSSRLELAEALIHSYGGLDEAGLAALHEADELATATGHDETVAEVRAELGYVDFLRGRYSRAERWLEQARAMADSHPAVSAKAITYLGSCWSDRAAYERAAEALGDGLKLAERVGDSRREAYASSMLGRLHLLRGELDDAARSLERAIARSEQDRWLAFLPWPQALLGEVHLTAGRIDDASALLDHAFARACQLGDPCWEGMSARALGLRRAIGGDPDGAIESLVDARARCNRKADPYTWLDAYILDALCGLAVARRHPDAGRWVATMTERTSRSGMRELQVRALRHAAALGDLGAAATASMLAAGIANPRLAADGR